MFPLYWNTKKGLFPSSPMLLTLNTECEMQKQVLFIYGI